MSYDQAIVYGPNRNWYSFRNNTNITASNGALLYWDSVGRVTFGYAAGTASTATGSSLSTATAALSDGGYDNPYAFQTGFDAIVAMGSSSLGELLCGFSMQNVGPRQVGTALVKGFHDSALIVGGTTVALGGGPVTSSLLFAPYGGFANWSGAGTWLRAGHSFIGMAQPLAVDSTDVNLTRWIHKDVAVCMASPTLASTNVTASFFTGQIFARIA